MTRDYRNLTRAFEDGALQADGFTHEDHIGVAWRMLTDHEFLEASRRYADGLRSLAIRAGVPEKFNMTITMAFMSLIAERIARAPGAPFDKFLANNPDLTSHGLLDRWYSKGRLNTDLARSAFLMPDRAGAPA
jgi:hypothetical protein